MQKFMLDELEKFEGVEVTGTKNLDKRLPGHCSVAVANCEGEALVMQLDLKGVCCSSASACHKGIVEPSHVLAALNISCELLKGSVRITMGKFNTMDECKQALEVMKTVFSAQKAAPALNS